MKKSVLATLLLLGLTTQLRAQTLAAYQTTVNAQGPSVYFTLDSTLVDSVGGSLSLIPTNTAPVYGSDLFRDYNKAFIIVQANNGLFTPSDIIPGGGPGPDDAATGKGTIVLLFGALQQSPPSGQRFIFAQNASSANSNGLALFVENSSNPDPGAIKLRVGNTTATILDAADLYPVAWYYFAMTYDETNDTGEVTWYLGRQGGTLNSGTINLADGAVIGDNGPVFLGNNPTVSSGFRDGTASQSVGRLDEFAVFDRALSASEINAQWSKIYQPNPQPRPNYQNTVSNQLPAYYFRLDGSSIDSVNNTLSLNQQGGGYTRDYFGSNDGAFNFIASSDALFVNQNLLNGGGSYNGNPGTGKGSVSMLFRMLNYTNQTGQRFLFSAGGATGSASIPGTNGFGLLIENLTSTTSPGSLKLRFGNSSRPILENTNFLYSDWYYFAMTYDETALSNQVTYYLGNPGGTLQSETLSFAVGSLAGQGNIFILGNHTNFNARFSTPGNGVLDECAIWHNILSSSQIQAQFAGIENTSPGTPPTLGIFRSGGDAILYWPTEGSAGYNLEATTSLTVTNWAFAGASTPVGTNNYVTNSIAGTNRFFRLHKP